VARLHANTYQNKKKGGGGLVTHSMLETRFENQVLDRFVKLVKFANIYLYNCILIYSTMVCCEE